MTTSTAEHEEILAKLQDLQTALDRHLKNDHAHIMERPEIEAMITTIRTETTEVARKMEALVTMMKGPVDAITGEHRDEEGIEGKINQLWRMTQNGGLPAKVVTPSQQSRTDRTGIWIAAISGVTAAISAIVVAYLQSAG